MLTRRNELLNELQPWSRHCVSGFVYLLSGPHYTVLPLLEMISRVDGPFWMDGAYKLVGGSWYSEQLPYPTVIHWAVDPSLMKSTSLGLLIFSCQILVQGVEKKGWKEDS